MCAVVITISAYSNGDGTTPARESFTDNKTANRTSCHEAADVRHVGMQNGANVVADLTEARIVQMT